MRPYIDIFNYSMVQNKSELSCDIYIDGEIVDAPTQEIYKAFWGDETSVSFKSFRNQLIQARTEGCKIFNINVCSPGGHVGDAMAMRDFLAELETQGFTVNRKGYGIVASASTMLVVDKNGKLAKNAWLMIHNVSGAIAGSVTEVENYAKAMRKFNDQIRDYYVDVTGQAPETISGWMNKETYLNAEEAKKYGFVCDEAEEMAPKNVIKPEYWPFQNQAILNLYNSSIKNQPDMDFKNIGQLIKNAIKEGLKAAGIEAKPVNEVKIEDITNVMANAVDVVFKDLEQGIKDAAQNAVTEALKNIGENEAFKNATNGLAKSEDVATKKELEKLTNDVAEKLGKQLPTKTKTNDTNTGADHDGISFESKA